MALYFSSSCFYRRCIPPLPRLVPLPVLYGGVSLYPARPSIVADILRGGFGSRLVKSRNLGEDLGLRDPLRARARLTFALTRYRPWLIAKRREIADARRLGSSARAGERVGE